MTVRQLATVAAVVAVMTVLAAGLGSGEGNAVTIGVVAPLSGPRAYLGEEILNGVRLAVDELNREGGLLGEPVELQVVDDADLVQLPAQLAELAEREHVTAVIGPEAPGVVLADRSPLARRGVPALLPASFSGELGNAPAPVFRIVPSADAQARALGRWLSRYRAVDSVAVLVADPVEGAAVADGLVTGLRKGGVETVELLEVPADTARFDAAVSNLRERLPDAGALLLWGPPPTAARATLAARRVGWDLQLLVPSSAFVSEYRTLAGQASEGVVLAFPFREEWFRGPELTNFLLRYYREYGLGALPDLDTLVLDVPVVAAASYDATMLVAAAAENAGSATPTAVADALARITYDGLLKTYDQLDRREAWAPTELDIARFHHLATTF
ncbi:MAG: ABC transporter substrate-binding protein, partial [Nitriliruptorales bacterium]|nr:ABC transporter substrate-binding protein [Nitriliruptorales bacterium]